MMSYSTSVEEQGRSSSVPSLAAPPPSEGPPPKAALPSPPSRVPHAPLLGWLRLLVALDGQGATARPRSPTRPVASPPKEGFVEGANGKGHSVQIFRTRAESQRIVAARPLCRLQYPVRAKSSAKDLPH